MRNGLGKKGLKRGVASFYVVAFSTLILVIVAASFAAIIISEINRTANDDLSQSAYDSALAGVEDAKLAFANYTSCLERGESKASGLNGDGVLSCGEIIYIMEDEEKSCDMTARMLGRLSDNANDVGEVIVKESDVDNKMLQAYTCVKIQTVLKDYRSTLSEANSSKIVRVRLDDRDASEVKTVRISWYADSNSTLLNFNNFDNSRVTFPSIVKKRAATPPTIGLTLIQTKKGGFSYSDFERTVGSNTDRGTLFLVPTNNKEAAGKNLEDNYYGAYNGLNNMISSAGFIKSNDKTVKNLPYAVYCDPDGGNEFVCSATIALPDPVGGERSNDTFVFVVSLPYNQPSTDFALELCDNANGCSETRVENDEEEIISHQMNLKGMQISIDSTGRANDLFRRVETRLEGTDDAYPYPLYAIQLLGDENDKSLLKKKLNVTCEWNFPNRGC